MLAQVRKSKMYRKLRKVKSEVPARVNLAKVKIERSKTPLRYSRRLRHLPPEYMEYYDAIRDTLKQGKQVISQESSVQFTSKQRRLHYPQKVDNSKELVSILSAPKLNNRKTHTKKATIVARKLKGIKCKSKTCAKLNELPFHQTKTGSEKVLQQRKKYVLDVLNKGDMKDIEKLPTVGSKTAERIVLYRLGNLRLQ